MGWMETVGERLFCLPAVMQLYICAGQKKCEMCEVLLAHTCMWQHTAWVHVCFTVIVANREVTMLLCNPEVVEVPWNL